MLRRPGRLKFTHLKLLNVSALPCTVKRLRVLLGSAPELTRLEVDLAILREGVFEVVFEDVRVVPPGAGTSRSCSPALVPAASPPRPRPGQPSMQLTLASATRLNGVHGIDSGRQAVCSKGEYSVSLASRTYSWMHRRKLLFMLAQLPAVN